MKPNDQNGGRPVVERPFRVLILAGSDRRQYNCPGVDSKARTFMLRMAERLPQEWELDLYARLDLADAWAIVAPVNWYGPTSNLKLLFDRLVCMNGGNPREALIKHKDPELAMQLEHSPEWPELSVNHLEGRTAGFFCYGDAGGDEMDAAGRPKLLRHKEWFDPAQEPFKANRDSYAPLVWQCRYGGIEVPDELWHYTQFGIGEKYSDNQAEHLPQRPEVIAEFDAWTERFAAHVRAKGKVRPGLYRAFGYQPPHRWRDVQLGWRDARMRLGLPRKNSSPEKQQAAGLNQDATLHPKQSTRLQSRAPK